MGLEPGRVPALGRRIGDDVDPQSLRSRAKASRTWLVAGSACRRGLLSVPI